MRESSNPVFRSLPKTQGGYATFGTGAAGYGAQQVHAQQYAPEYLDKQQPGVARPLTIDDVVTRTGISLAIVSLVGVVSYFLVAGNPGLMMPTFFLARSAAWSWSSSRRSGASRTTRRSC